MRSQEWFEISNDALDKSERLLKRWEQSFTAEDPRLGTRLANSEFHILLKCRLKNTVEEFVALLQPIISSVVWSGKKTIFGDGDEEPMLINVVRLMEKPETILPTLVRLETVHLTDRCGTDESLYLSTSLGYVVRKVPPYRKGEPGGFAKIDVGVGDLCQLEGEMIQRAPEVLQHVPSDSEHAERCLLQRSEILRRLPSLLIEVGSDYCRVRAPKLFSFGLEISEMCLGPIGLYPDTD